ncbi:MAG: tetratricopeptide repeat protein [Flavobacteriales bacterium]
MKITHRLTWILVVVVATAGFSFSAEKKALFHTNPAGSSDTSRWRKLEIQILAEVGVNNDSALAKSERIRAQATLKNNKKWIAHGNFLVGASLYYKKKYEESILFLKKAEETEEARNDTYLLGECYYRLGSCYYRLEKYDESLEYFHKGIPLFEKDKREYNKANSYMFVGNVYYERKVNDKAKEYYKKAAVEFEKLNETYYAADVLYNLGNIEYFRDNEYAVARKSFTRAAEYYDANNEAEYSAYSWYYVGEIGYYYAKEHATAIPAYEKALTYYREKNDSKKIASIQKNLADMYEERQDYDKALPALNETISLYEKENDYTKLGDLYIGKANIAYFRGDYLGAHTAYQKSLVNYEKANSNDGMGGSYVGLGNLYHSKNEETKALEMYTKSLQYYEKAGNTHYIGISSALTGMGNIYYSAEEYDKALEYYTKGLEYDDKSENPGGKVVKLMNISNIYVNRNEFDKAEEYLKKSMEENEKTGNKQKKASILNLMGFFHNKQKKYEDALKECGESLKISEELGLLPQTMENQSCLYNANYNLGNFQEALNNYYYYIAARDSINNEKRNRELTKQQLQYEYELKETTLKSDQEKKELAHQEELKRKQLMFMFERQQDVMKAEAEKKELRFHEDMKRKQLAMDFEKQQIASKLEFERKQNREKLEKEKVKKDLERKKIQNQAQKKITYWLIAGLSLMCVLAFFIYRGYREKRKANLVILLQKEEVEKQKEEITHKSLLLEEKNKEIVDSINYAKRLQEAILPPQKLVKEYLKDSFILYKPKDIVAGDFYWMEQREGILFFAAADCTGHGVPGAMVSVVCSNALDRAVKEFQITDPGKILDKVRELVIETFEKSESEVKDGMDISLCSLKFDVQGSRPGDNVKPQTTNVEHAAASLQWAGANNPLWILRKDAQELEEIKPDKQPIGIFSGATPFTTHHVIINTGDSLYLFTDGYADQFGGEKGKKFKASNMKKLIMQVRSQPMEGQYKVMNEYFESWRGSLEQIDDVCMIGVRV